MEGRKMELLCHRERTSYCPTCGAKKSDVYGRDRNPANRTTKAIIDHVKEYCSATSIHGVQYLGESGRPFSERIWWIVIFIISFFGNSYLIRQIWTKWNESPVIVTFAETTTPVWEIPFPTVTVCPLAPYRNSEHNYQKALYNESAYPELQEDVEAISLLCSNPNLEIIGKNTTDRDLLRFYNDVRLSYYESTLSIRWQQEDIDPEGFFTEILTADGICYSFNILDYIELYRSESWPPVHNHSLPNKGWNIENGYLNSDKDNYPKRISDAGIFGGLEILLMGNLDDFDYICHGFTPGYKIVLSSPGEVPNVREKFLIAEPDKNVYIGVNPDIIETSSTLKSYKPITRQCYFPSERYLSHFRLYTQKNCELECLTNYTLEKCHCIEFYMPRHNGSHTPICGPGSKSCIDQVKKMMPIMESLKQNEGKECDCMPSCRSTTYKLDVTQHRLEWKKLIELGILGDIYNESIREYFTQITIYFTDKQYTTSKRNELYGLVDFLANCGGLIGLFSGFSVLSIIEIIYFLTLRCRNSMKKAKDNSIRMQ